MIIIDGSYGEGGGQVIRTALTLSALTGKEMKIENIRAGRRKPGLRAQHLTGVLATAQLCAAQLAGAEMGSQTLTFAPQTAPYAGSYHFDVAETSRSAGKGGSAGSVGLVFQTVILPLLLSDAIEVGEQSYLTIAGGTHVAWSPPYHYLERVYLPMLRRMGAEVKIEMARWGIFPRGGGKIKVKVRRALELTAIDLTERGDLVSLRGMSVTSNLPDHVGERQRKSVDRALREHGLRPKIDLVTAQTRDTGTHVSLFAEFANARAGFIAFGKRGKRAEVVGEEAAREFLKYYDSGAALDEHLADQLILPMALAQGESRFTTARVTQHLLTNIWVVQQFLPVQIEVDGAEGELGHVVVRG